jgi:hypothetical protein
MKLPLGGILIKLELLEDLLEELLRDPEGDDWSYISGETLTFIVSAVLSVDGISRMSGLYACRRGRLSTFSGSVYPSTSKLDRTNNGHHLLTLLGGF